MTETWIDRFRAQVRAQQASLDSWYNAPVHPTTDLDLAAEHEYEESITRKRYPKGNWQPGDPIYLRGQTNVVRYMAEFVDDEDIEHIGETGLAWMAWRHCLHCDVAWGCDEEPVTNNCWSCGRWGRKARHV